MVTNPIILARYKDLRYRLLCAAIFFISIKLSITYVFLLPCIVLTLYEWVKNRRFYLNDSNYLYIPLALFVIAIIISSIFGVDPLKSFSGIGTLALVTLLPMIVCYHVRDDKLIPIIQIFLAGQAVAAIESILNAIFSDHYTQIFLGALTESGQLAMSTVLCAGLTLSWIKKETDISLETKKWLITRGTALFLLIVLTAFNRDKIINLFALSVLIIFSLYRLVKSLERGEKIIAWGESLITFISPVLFATLCINLKRGPWAGVIVALVILLFLYSRRLLMFFILGLLGIYYLSAPISERLSHSYQHFEISGGRGTIWRVAGELIGKYPLGVGWDNARILQYYTAEVPAELTHFHSNIINIAIEGGAVSTAIFVWWLVSIFRFCFFTKLAKNQILLKSLGAALVSWQVAGVVEYNFGDTEIFIVALFIAGLILSLEQRQFDREFNFSS